MNQSRNSFIMIVTILLVAFFYHFFHDKYDRENLMVAEIDGQKLYYSDLETFAKKQDIELNEKTRKYMLDDMLAQKIILAYARKSGILHRELQKDIDNHKKVAEINLIAERFFDLQTLEYVKVTPKETKRYYKSHIFYTIRAMNFEKNANMSLQRAQTALSRLKEGELFIDIYQDTFPEDDSQKPGLVGVTDLEEATDDLKREIRKLKKKGDFSEIVESKTHYSIYYRDANPSYSETRDYIYKKLYYQQKEKTKYELLDKLTNSITMNYYEINKMMSDTTDTYAFYYNNDLAISSLYKQKLTVKDFLKRAKEDYKIENIYTYSEKEVQQLAHSLLLQDVILEYAKDLKFQNNPIFKKELSKKMAELDEQIALNTIAYVLENYIKIEEPSIADMQKEYFDNQEYYRKPSLFKIQEIYVKKKSTADEVLALARDNYNFNQLVQKYSEDDGKNYDNGRTAYLDANDLGREYKLFEKHKKNDILDLREDLHGNYIITKIIDVQAGALLGFNDSKMDVFKRLYSNRLNEKLDDICNEYSIHVRKYYENLKPPQKQRVRKLTGFK